jgi:hypothetical protein
MCAPAKLGVLLHEGDALDGEVLAEEVDLVAHLGSYRIRHARWRLEHGPAHRAEFGGSDDYVAEVAVVVGEAPQLVGGERRTKKVQPVGAVGHRLEGAGVEGRVLAAVVKVDVAGFDNDRGRAARSCHLQAAVQVSRVVALVAGGQARPVVIGGEQLQLGWFGFLPPGELHELPKPEGVGGGSGLAPIAGQLAELFPQGGSFLSVK